MTFSANSGPPAVDWMPPLKYTSTMRFSWLLLLMLCIGLSSIRAGAAGPGTEIRITLFGQPCSLKGPIDERVLRLIHSLSPEQLYPQQGASGLSSAPTRKALEKLRTMTGTPPALDRYRERLTKRFEAQLALLEAFEGYKKDKKIAPILAVSKGRLRGGKLKEFDAAVRKAEASKTLAKAETLESLFDVYGEAIEPDPEEEFHRAIQRINVQYTCSFEESGDSPGAENAGG